MIDMRYKPRFLPQVSAPFSIVLQKLDDDGVGYGMVEVDPNELQPSQGITFSDEVGRVNVDDMNPIWISNDMKVLDGHHRMVRALLDGIKLKAVKIDLNDKDASRVLNRIQDIYEYEQARGMEEVEMQDPINGENQIDAGVSQSEFLASLEEDNLTLQSEAPSTNQTTVVAYRKEPIKENSVIGNFFTLKPMEGYSKYEIDFDNLLDTTALGVTYKDGQQPVDILAKSWFPHVNFEKLGTQYNTPSINLKNKAVAEKAMKMGYDGIKYGDTLIQGLK
jgi:hypothetical protein